MILKQTVHQKFIDQLRLELSAIRSAAKNSIELATHAEHQAESKYDTFGLESSYLARGQAKRVEELTDSLERLEMLELKPLDVSSPVQLSALVELETAENSLRRLFFGPAAGGEEVTVNDMEFTMVTSRSPLGQAVLGKRVGETVELKLGIDTQKFTVRSIQ